MLNVVLANAIFGKVGRISSEEIVLQLATKLKANVYQFCYTA